MTDKIFEKLLIHSIKIYKRSEGTTDEWNLPSEEITLTDTINGLIQPLREEISIERRGERDVARFACYIKYSDKDKIALDDIIEDSENNKYKVLSIEDEGGQHHHLRLLLKKL